MYDIIKITKITKDIEEYFLKLKNINLTKENVIIDEKFFSASMILFSILNRMIDLAGEIIVKNDFGMPANYEQYFDVLRENGIIDKILSNELKKLVKDRNLFAHEYYLMDKKSVVKISKDICSVRDFVERIKKLIEKEGKNKK